MRIPGFKQLRSDYGMALVLVLLALLFSSLTYSEQHPSGEDAGRQVSDKILSLEGERPVVLIVARRTEEDTRFARTLERRLRQSGHVQQIEVVQGEPRDARRTLERLVAAGQSLDYIACTQLTASWQILSQLDQQFASLAGARLVVPESYWWPDFLKYENLLNITNQIAVIAIVAVGMTIVIVTGGIDLSVGSLIALSAVLTCLMIRRWAGAVDATAAGMLAAALGGCLACGLVGGVNGLVITTLRVPPFIATLAMMLMAGGTAYLLTGGESVYQVPAGFVWLGRGSVVADLPNSALLMLLIYVAAHVLMTRTALGRYLYAVGGNPQAARLSGVPVRRVLLFAYMASGALAGLGGVVMASQLKSGSPTYGEMYELYCIAAAVVGGTSLAGGRGKVFGTLIGALIIAVIQNGMNLMSVESYTQRLVLGAVILAAVQLDSFRRRLAT